MTAHDSRIASVGSNPSLCQHSFHAIESRVSSTSDLQTPCRNVCKVYANIINYELLFKNVHLGKVERMSKPAKPKAKKERKILSDVVAALIASAIVGILGALVPGGWPAIFRVLGIGAHKIWSWIAGSAHMSGWGVLIVAAIFLLAGLILGIRFGFYLSKASEGLSRLKIGEGMYYEILWRWNHNGQEIYNLAAFCPTCDLQLDHLPALTSFGSFRGTSFRCDSCQRDIYRFDLTYDEVENLVVRNVQRDSRRNQSGVTKTPFD